MKERALSLFFESHLPKDLCDLFGFSDRSLRRRKEHIYQHGNAIPPLSRRQGRRPKLDSDRVSGVMTQLLVEPDMDLDEIQTWVTIHHEIGISRCGPARPIEDVGFSYKLLHRAAAERDDGEGEEFWA